jgi:hypothetical protein
MRASVFSMDGDIVNLPELMRITDTHGFLSMKEKLTRAAAAISQLLYEGNVI